MQAQCFAARWSLSVWIITLVAIVLIALAAGGMMWTAARDWHGSGTWLLVAGALVLSMSLCVTVLFAPLGYAVVPGAIVIQRMARDVAIGFGQIGEIRRIDAKEIGFVIRVFGSGGFWGWFGRFYGSRLGWFTAYCSSGRDLAVITLTTGAKIVISPHPADGFVEAVERGRRSAT